MKMSDSVNGDKKASPIPRNPVYYVVSAAVMLGLLAFILSCKLAVQGEFLLSADNSLAQTMLGDMRMALSAKFFDQADLYFHRGVPHQHERAFKSNPFQLIRQKVSPTKHVHAKGAEIKEIFPWLEMAIKANPKNIDSYLVASFWLTGETGRPDLALKVINLAQHNLPDSYKPLLEKGRILLHTGQHQKALNAFTSALILWNKNANKDERGEVLDKSQILLYRGLLLEENGDIAGALDNLEELLKIIPPTPEMTKRVNMLKAGKTPDPSARDLLSRLALKYDKDGHHCHREDHNGHNEHDDDCDHEH
jgi:tetratricopeptide (TPR) repeat protein